MEVHMKKESCLSDSTVRRTARRVGLIAKKSRQRAHVPNLDNLGDFMLVDAETGFVLAGSNFELSAEDLLEICRRRSSVS